MIKFPEINSKKSLAKALSLLEKQDLSTKKIELEQYETDANTAAEWTWNAALLGDVKDKTALDNGAGNGILGIGLGLLGAKKIIFVEQDKDVMEVCKKNWKTFSEHYFMGESEFKLIETRQFTGKADVVFQNPPFGTKQKHHDKQFLEKAFTVGKIVYSMHKTTTEEFVLAIAKDHGFRITHTWNFTLPLPKSYEFHTKAVGKTEVTIYRLQAQSL